MENLLIIRKSTPARMGGVLTRQHHPGALGPRLIQCRTLQGGFLPGAQMRILAIRQQRIHPFQGYGQQLGGRPQAQVGPMGKKFFLGISRAWVIRPQAR